MPRHKSLGVLAVRLLFSVALRLCVNHFCGRIRTVEDAIDWKTYRQSALVFRSGVGVLLTALILVPLVARMNSEEKLLSSQFGAEYDAWHTHTWRLIPYIY